MSDTARCPCRKKSETTMYAACCGRYHRGEAKPPTPEALMRSRYSAFALHIGEYLIDTWHPTTRPDKIEFEDGRDWYMLKVIAAHTEGDVGTVSFSARSRMDGRTYALEEVSRFVREAGRWYYVQGVVKA